MEDIDAYRIFQISSAILSIAVLVDTLNFFFKKELYHDKYGLFSYDKLILDRRKNLQVIFTKFPYLFKYKPYYRMMLVRLACCFFLLFFVSAHWSIFLVLFACQLIFNVRNVYCLSGADQMQNILLFGFLIFSMGLGDSISLLTFYFITIQMLFSYFFTGYHKMKARKWRNGTALLLVLNSETFGNQKVVHFLHSNKKIAVFFCWAIMLTQVSFIVSFFVFPAGVLFYLSILFLFHLSIAFLMHLNHFFWVYVAGFPIVYYTFNQAWKFL